ncbi:hypothetical protein ACLOJK_010757 [Asimina triloba]
MTMSGQLHIEIFREELQRMSSEVSTLDFISQLKVPIADHSLLLNPIDSQDGDDICTRDFIGLMEHLVSRDTIFEEQEENQEHVLTENEANLKQV